MNERFPTGAQRDNQDGKTRVDLICPHFEKALGDRLAEGAGKYGERNWERGMPNDRLEASMMRHLNAYRRGHTDEDHLAAAAFNLMGLISQRERVKLGLLDPEDVDV